MPRRRKPHRGVLLLIVLSLLVLFVLIGVTFIVVAGQYTKAAKAYSRHELKGDPPAKELDGALMQLLRGSADPNDLMYRHNLLRDVYGVDGFEGIVLNTAYGGQNGQQFLAMQFGDVFGGARPTDHYYAGSVLTLLDGQGVGHSTRIVGYRAPTLVNGVRAGLLYLESFDELPPGFMPAPSTRFLVNGKPFNGSGDTCRICPQLPDENRNLDFATSGAGVKSGADPPDENSGERPRERPPEDRKSVRLVACANCHTQYDVSDVVEKTFPCRCGEILENQPPAPVDAEIRRCGACGALVTPDAENCDYCNSAIVRDDDRDLSLICPECYARNADDSRFCTACGVTLPPGGRPHRGPRAPVPGLLRSHAAASDRRGRDQRVRELQRIVGFRRRTSTCS